MPYFIDNPFYVTKTGDKYHKEGCPYLPENLEKDAFPVSEPRAVSCYEPCKFCISNIKK